MLCSVIQNIQSMINEALSILCDKQIPISLKSMFYKTVMRFVNIYESECQAIELTEDSCSRDKNVKIDLQRDQRRQNIKLEYID